MIPVGRLAPGGQWDQNLLDRLFANTLYPTGLDFKRFEGYPNTDGCVLICPGRYWAMRTAEISEALARYRWVLFMRTGDEEDLFDIAKVQHPNIRFWVQTPHVGVDYGAARLFGVGFPPAFNDLPKDPPGTFMDVFLAAQNTHDRRRQCFEAVQRCEGDIAVWETEGFTQGLEPKVYRGSMVAAKVAPAPSGAVSPDSFRLWEALEAHAVPIADDVSPVYDSRGFWDLVCPAPFPVLTDYNDLPGYIADVLQDWPANANRVAAYWIAQKRRYAHWLVEDLKAIGAV